MKKIFLLLLIWTLPLFASFILGGEGEGPTVAYPVRHASRTANVFTAAGFTNRKSFKFEGDVDSDVIDVSNHASLQPTNKMSMCAWIKPHDLSDHSPILTKWHDNASAGYGLLVLDTGTLFFQIPGTGGWVTNKVSRRSADDVIKRNRWHHVCGTYNKDGGVGEYIHLYINGVVDDSQAEVIAGTPGINESASDVAIGVRTNGQWPARSYIDEVVYWQNEELTAAEVVALYNDRVPIDPADDDGDYVSSANATAHWRMGDDAQDDATASTGTIRDQIGSNHGTPSGTDGDEIVLDVVGPHSNSYSVVLDGTDEHVDMGDALDKDHDDAFSVSAWVATQLVTPGIYGIVGKRENSGTNTGWWLYRNNNAMYFQIVQDSGGAPGSKRIGQGGTTQIHNTGSVKWRHLVATYDGSGAHTGIKLYFNGTEESYTGAQTDGISGSCSNSEKLAIGAINATSPAWYWNGWIDEPVVFDKVLSQVEITELYNSGTALDMDLFSAAGNIEGWWRMGDVDDSPSTIKDRSTNSNDGTPTNMEAADITEEAP